MFPKRSLKIIKNKTSFGMKIFWDITLCSLLHWERKENAFMQR